MHRRLDLVAQALGLVAQAVLGLVAQAVLGPVGSSWHQPCQRCKYTTSVDIQKTCYKKLFTHVESHASAVSLLESG